MNFEIGDVVVCTETCHEGEIGLIVGKEPEKFLWFTVRSRYAVAWKGIGTYWHYSIDFKKAG